MFPRNYSLIENYINHFNCQKLMSLFSKLALAMGVSLLSAVSTNAKAEDREKAAFSATTSTKAEAKKNEAAANGSIEAIVGHEAIGLDLKVSKEIIPGVEFFTRHLPTAPYHGSVDYFGLVSLGASVGNGFNVLLQGQFTLDGAAPRIGIDYLLEGKNQQGGASFYIQAVMIPEYTIQIELLASGEVHRRTSDNTSIILTLETIMTLQEDSGIKTNETKTRIGINYYGITFGSAFNVLQEYSQEPRYNVGVAVRIDI